jgi:hypothetical protein
MTALRRMVMTLQVAMETGSFNLQLLIEQRNSEMKGDLTNQIAIFSGDIT